MGARGGSAPVVGWSSRTDLPCALVLAWDLLRAPRRRSAGDPRGCIGGDRGPATASPIRASPS